MKTQGKGQLDNQKNQNKSPETDPKEIRDW